MTQVIGIVALAATFLLIVVLLSLPHARVGFKEYPFSMSWAEVKEDMPKCSVAFKHVDKAFYFCYKDIHGNLYISHGFSEA